MVNGNVRRLALQPARRVAAPVVVVHGGGDADLGEEASDPLAMMATPMPTPRNLHDLWSEYLHGVGGGSPQGYSPTLSEDAQSIVIAVKKLCGIQYWDLFGKGTLRK